MMRRIISATAAIAVLVLLIVWFARRDRMSPVPAAIPAATQLSAPAEPIENAQLAAEHAHAAAESKKTESTAASRSASPAASTPFAPQLDSAEILVRGSVRDERGELLPSCGLIWIDESGRRSYVSTQAGAYSLPGVHPGAYIVVLYGTDLRREGIDTTLAAEPAVQQRDFVAHAQPDIIVRLKGREAQLSNAGGAGVKSTVRLDQGLTVRASLRAPRAELRSMPSDGVEYSDCGMYFARTLQPPGAVLPADGIGRLRLDETPPLFVGLYCGNTLLESRKLEELPRELVFEIDPERILAQRTALRARLVRREDGAAIPSKLVMLDLLSKRTDAAGSAEYSNLIPGPHAFEILLEDGSTQKHMVVLPAGKRLDLGDVALRPLEKLSVHFELPAGERPEVNFMLKKDEPGDPLEALALGPLFQSQQEDPTRISYPGAGTFVLRVVSVSAANGKGSPPLSAFPLRATLGDAPGETLSVKLLPTTAVCLRPPRDSKHDSRWLIALENGEPFKLVRCRGREPTSVGLPQGSYTIARIDPLTEKIGTAMPFLVGAGPSTVELKP